MKTKLEIGEVYEITVDDNGRHWDASGEKETQEIVDEPSQLTYLGRLVAENDKFWLLQTCTTNDEADNNNDYYKALKSAIVCYKHYHIQEAKLSHS